LENRGLSYKYRGDMIRLPDLLISCKSCSRNSNLTGLAAIGLDGRSVTMNTYRMSITPKAIKDLLGALEASRASRKRAWEILQEIRDVLKDTAGIDAQRPARKTMIWKGESSKTQSESHYRIAKRP
jgi:hypothetical protein